VGGAALSFTAILALKASPSELGLLTVTTLAPQFLGGVPAGLFADRLDRRSLMIAADVGRALVLLSVPLAAFAGKLTIVQIYLVSILTGLLTILFDVADRAVLPSLIPRTKLVEGNSKLTASSSVAEFFGFSIAGWLVQWLTGPIAMLVDALSFVGSALLLGGIPRQSPIVRSDEVSGNLWREATEGFRLARRDVTLSALAAGVGITGLSGGIVGATIVAFMVRGLGFAPGILGMIWALGGAGSLVGAVAAGPVTARLGTTRALWLGALVSGLGVLMVPAAHGAGIGAGLLLIANQLLTDPAYTIYEINQVSLRQSLSPEGFEGRISAIIQVIGLGAAMAGALLGGMAAEQIGLRATLIIGGLGYIIAALVLAARLRKRPEVETAK
jgi:predicted MFS family arabinose efflux permease